MHWSCSSTSDCSTGRRRTCSTTSTGTSRQRSCPAPRSTCSPISPLSTRTGAGCRPAIAAGCGGRSPGTASTVSNGHRRSRRRCCGCSGRSAGSRRRRRWSRRSWRAARGGAATAATDVSPPGAGGDRVADSAAAQHLRALLLRVAGAAELRQQTVADLARELRFRYFEEPVLELAFRAVYDGHRPDARRPAGRPGRTGRASWIDQVVSCPQPLRARLRQRYLSAERALSKGAARDAPPPLLPNRATMWRRASRRRRRVTCSVRPTSTRRQRVHVVVAYTHLGQAGGGRGCDRQPRGARRTRPPPRRRPRDVASGDSKEAEPMAASCKDRLAVATSVASCTGSISAVTSEGPVAENSGRCISPTGRTRRRVRPKSCCTGTFTRCSPNVWSCGTCRSSPSSGWRRWRTSTCSAASPTTTPTTSGCSRSPRCATSRRCATRAGRVVALPHLERMTLQALAAMRTALGHLPTKIAAAAQPRHAPRPADLGPVPGVVAGHRPLARAADRRDRSRAGRRTRAHVRAGRGTEPREVVVEVENVSEQGVSVRVHPPDDQPVRPLTAYGQKVLRSQRIGTVYPYELLRLLTPPPGTVADFPPGRFVEHDLDEDDRLVPVERPDGRQQRARRGRRAHELHGKGPRGHGTGGHPRRSHQEPRLGGRARVPAHHAPPSTSPSRCRCRSSGSRSPPAPGSRWTAARRTWTGSRPPCAGSSSSPRPAGR